MQSSLESNPPCHCARGTVTGSFIVAIFRFLHPTLTSLARRKDNVLVVYFFCKVTIELWRKIAGPSATLPVCTLTHTANIEI